MQRYEELASPLITLSQKLLFVEYQHFSMTQTHIKTTDYIFSQEYCI